MNVPQLVRQLELQGWENRTGKRHIKLRSPAGKTLVISRTPSCQRAMANTIALARQMGARL